MKLDSFWRFYYKFVVKHSSLPSALRLLPTAFNFLQHQRHHLCMRFVDRAARVDHPNSGRLTFCHVQITRSHPFMKIGVLFIECSEQSTHRARPQSSSRRLWIEIKYNGEIGL